MAGEEIARFLPLNPRVFAILAVLLEGPSHGYGLKLEVESRSSGTVTLDPGSLYRAMARMVADGLVEEVGEPPGAEPDARRRYYGITSLGRAVAAAEAGRLRGLLRRAPLGPEP